MSPKSIRNQPRSELGKAMDKAMNPEPISEYDTALANFFIMRKMRQCFGTKSYNSEKLFPDPRKHPEMFKKPVRKLKLI